MAEDSHVPPLPRRTPDDERHVPGGTPGWGSGLTHPLALPESLQQRIRAALDYTDDEAPPPEHDAPQAAEAIAGQPASLPRRVPGANNGPEPPAHIARPAMLPSLVHPAPAEARAGPARSHAGRDSSGGGDPVVRHRRPAEGRCSGEGRRLARAAVAAPAVATPAVAAPSRASAGARPAVPRRAAAGPARILGRSGQRGPPASHPHDTGGHVGAPRAGGSADGAAPGHPRGRAGPGGGEDKRTARRCRPAGTCRRPGG